MIIFENTKVSGWEPAIRGMRNPMNSWDRSDSIFERDVDCGFPEDCESCDSQFDKCACQQIGPNDMALMKRLASGGPVHGKYKRMIIVYVDVTAPLYWFKEYDTYKIGTVANSCSTMHKIHEKEFALEDFSYDHLIGEAIAEIEQYDGSETLWGACDLFDATLRVLNAYRKKFLETNDKKYWWQMIQLLPSSYNQKRTLMLNYEVLTNIYHSRKDHKLDEWRAFCSWIESLPYAKELIIGEDGRNAE